MLKRRLWSIPSTESTVALGSVGTEEQLAALESSLFFDEFDRCGEDLSPLDPSADVFEVTIDIYSGVSHMCRPLFRSELLSYIEGKISPEPLPEAIRTELIHAEGNVWHFLEHGTDEFNICVKRLGPLNLLLL